jgi:hypothetical protein
MVSFKSSLSLSPTHLVPFVVCLDNMSGNVPSSTKDTSSVEAPKVSMCPTCREEPGTIEHKDAPGVRFCGLECMMQHFESQDPNSCVDDAYKSRWAAEKRKSAAHEKAQH